MHFEVLVGRSIRREAMLKLPAAAPAFRGSMDTAAPGCIIQGHMWSYSRRAGSVADATKRILLDQLPKLLRGYGKTPGIDAVVVVLDTDRRDCRAFLKELKGLARACTPLPTTMFRLAIEEMEAWYLGDRPALLEAYPRAKAVVLNGYVQDSTCDTWETLADAVYAGGSAAIKKKGWPLPGKPPRRARIGPRMVLDRNVSPSFCKFRDGLRSVGSVGCGAQCGSLAVRETRCCGSGAGAYSDASKVSWRVVRCTVLPLVARATMHSWRRTSSPKTRRAMGSQMGSQETRTQTPSSPFFFFFMHRNLLILAVLRCILTTTSC